MKCLLYNAPRPYNIMLLGSSSHVILDLWKYFFVDSICYGYIVYGYKELHPLGLALFP